MEDNGDISVYLGTDPDTLYGKDNSLTFFFVPKNGHLYIEKFPQNHQDMLVDDDDLFEDVYADHLNGTRMDGRIRRELSSRGQAVLYGRAILGRLAFDGTTPVIAFWNSKKVPNDKENTLLFLKSLYVKFPAFRQFSNETVIVAPGKNPTTVAELTGIVNSSPPKRKIKVAPKAAPKAAPDKVYSIDGQNYRESEIRQMRIDIHTHKIKKHPVLCHPDMKKYPELNGYIPSDCVNYPPKPDSMHKWRHAARNRGVQTPGNYALEGFGGWMDCLESVGL